MGFRNQRAFDDPHSRMAAMGADLRASTALTDPKGNVLAYAQTGGMIEPVRHTIAAGAKLFRFGTRAAGWQRVATGAWWIEQPGFEKLLSFAQSWDLAIGMAMRMLCLVPPEWSDATLLVRARATEPLLAWRGLANSVVTPAKGRGPAVRMPEQNDISARRLHQLYIPGLAASPGILQVEQEYELDAEAGARGFIYV